MANLRTPGPIPLDDEILESLGTQMINHRGPEYKDLLFKTTEGLKKVFQPLKEQINLNQQVNAGFLVYP